MEVNNVELAAVTATREQFPTDGKPEFVFVGKSNVGKSSLINVMINRKSLARTSQHPGKTRTINFYNVENALYFVDLPGYGYAKVSKSESKKWGAMIEGYLLNRETIKVIVLLADIRHEPSANDKMLYEWLKYYNYHIIIAATKSDKIKRSQMPKHLSVLRKSFGVSLDKIIPFSSLTRDGKEALWELLETYL